MNCFDFRLYLECSGCGFRGRLDPHDEEGGGNATIRLGFFLDVVLECAWTHMMNFLNFWITFRFLELVFDPIFSPYLKYLKCVKISELDIFEQTLDNLDVSKCVCKSKTASQLRKIKAQISTPRIKLGTIFQELDFDPITPHILNI